MQHDRHAARAMQEARAAAKGRTDDIRPEGERGRYDALRAAEQDVSRSQAARERTRAPNWVEQRIVDCAYRTGIDGALVQVDAEGQRVGRIEALADQFRPESERQTQSIRILGREAFAARLEEAGVAIVRVTEADTRALEALRQDEQFARIAAETNGEAYRGRHFAELVTGELAAVTRSGDVHRINLDKTGAARSYLPDALQAVTETRARFATEREREGQLWTERRADIQASQQEYAAVQEQRASERAVAREASDLAATTEATIDRAAYEGLGKIFLRGLASLIGWLADSIAPPPPPTREQAERMARSAEEKHEARAQHEAQEAQHEFILSEIERSRQSLDQMPTQTPTAAELYGTPKPRAQERDNERQQGLEL